MISSALVNNSNSSGKKNNQMKDLLLFLFIMTSSLGLHAKTYQCLNQYTTKKISYGPIPEFVNQDYIVMTYFTPDDFSFPMQLKIIENLPKNTKALIVVPNSKKESSYYYEFAQGYREEISARFLFLESYIKSGRVELLEVPVADDFNGWSDHGNWARDFMSQLTIDKNGKIKFLNLKYHRESADRTDTYIQDYLIAKYEKQLGYKIEKIDAPFYFEWGNFTTDGKGNLFVSEKIFEINKGFHLDINKQEVNKWLRSQFGNRTKITWIKPPKQESTGHVDMIMKFLDSQRVLIAQTEHPTWKKYLDKIALSMEEKGYKVHRIDMALSDQEIADKQWAQFRSYTNSLIVGNTVYIPQFDDAGIFLGKKDEAARKTYRSLGFNVILVNNASSINAGGAAHCLTSTIPKLTNLVR